MGESVGLDLGAATSAAARLRGDAVDPAVLVPSADLGVGATSTRHRLESLAARAVGQDALPAVGVAIPPLDPAQQAEIEAAARDAFADPLLVLRPAAAAAWFQHTNEVHPDAHLVVVEADETEVAVSVLRTRPGTPVLVGPPSGRPLSAGDPAVDAIDAVATALTAAGLAPTDIDVAVLVGSATWLAGLAEGITAATHLAAIVDAEPRAAVAYGTALLAQETDGFGVGTALALGAPTLGVVGAGVAATTPSAAPPLGAGVGEAAGAAGGAGTGLGAALREMGQAKAPPVDPLGAGVGSGAGTSAGGAKAQPDHPDSPSGHAKSKGRLKRALTVAPAVAVVVVIGAVTVRSCDQSPDTTTLATSASGADPGEPGTSDTNSTGGGATNGSDKPDPLAPTSVPGTTSSSTTSTTRRPQAPTPPSAPAPPAPPPAPRDTTPPVATSLSRSVGDISANLRGCQFPTTTVLSATLTDDIGVASATIAWSTKGHSGTLTMAPAGNDTWSATLGPIDDNELFTFDSAPVDWSVEAVDTAGNRAGATAGDRGAVTFHGCVDPHGGIG